MVPMIANDQLERDQKALFDECSNKIDPYAKFRWGRFRAYAVFTLQCP
jgi:hypothetical protein